MKHHHHLHLFLQHSGASVRSRLSRCGNLCVFFMLLCTIMALLWSPSHFPWNVFNELYWINITISGCVLCYWCVCCVPPLGSHAVLLDTTIMISTCQLEGFHLSMSAIFHGSLSNGCWDTSIYKNVYNVNLQGGTGGKCRASLKSLRFIFPKHQCQDKYYANLLKGGGHISLVATKTRHQNQTSLHLTTFGWLWQFSEQPLHILHEQKHWL